MRIREFELDDYDAACHLWALAEGMSVVPRWEVERKLERDRDLFLVGEEDGELVAVVMGAYDGRRGWIFRLAVDPARRGVGLGRALIAELERRLLAMGVTSVRLLVHAGNTGGLGFWRQLGYELDEDIVMGSKELDGAAGSHC